MEHLHNHNTLLTTIETLTNGLHWGYGFVREDGTIGTCNDIIKELLGLVFPQGKSHEAGRLEPGDLVIIADNEIGGDDKLAPDDLTCLNIEDTRISMGDALLAIGVYHNKKFTPVYKFLPDTGSERKISLTERFAGKEISAIVDFTSNVTQITVDKNVYTLTYQESIGNMVILDGKTGRIKFFQELGYDLREEEIGEILRGKSFIEKNTASGGSRQEVEGQPLKKILYGDQFIDAIRSLLKQTNGATTEGVYDINRVLMFCSMVRVSNATVETPNLNGVHIFFHTTENMQNLSSSATYIESELERRRKQKRPVELLSAEADFREFIGTAPEMASVKLLAYKAAKHRFNVVITGESGTGKSRLAREIHKLQNEEAPFVEVNCNAIAPSLFESELFGYVPGAFTGAAAGGKAGFFEEANGGTIFLDEIGELPPDIQVKLLDVLQNKRIYRVGSAKPTQVDVRVITATNKNLKEEVAKNAFRQDLYYRINVFPIHIPPLRQRVQDLRTLIFSILSDACQQYHIEAKKISNEALLAMECYDWPGNVRELENVIERALTVCDGPVIYQEHLTLEEELPAGTTMKERLAEEEKRILKETLDKHNGDRKKVMKELDLTKSVLYNRINTFNLK